MKKRITALLLALCLIFSAAPVYAGAATGQQVCANAVTVTAGDTAYVTLEAKNFENIAALDVYVYYDASVFTVSGTTNGNMLSGAQASVNTAVAGEIKLSALALDGMNGTGTLLTIRLSTAWGCAPGTYPIIVAVGRAHDGNLAEAIISGADGSVTVNKPAQAEYFYLYGDVSASTVRMGDTLSCYVYNSNNYSFVSGEFIFNYDHELFAFDAVTLGAGLTGEGAIHSVNSSVLGQVRIVYANDKPVSAYSLFTVSLKAIADVETTSKVKAQAANLYKEDLTMYQPGSWSRSVMFKKLQQNDYPNAFLRSEQMIVGQQSTSVFAVEAGSGMAAADFTLTYDPAVLRCVSVAIAEGVSETGGQIVMNENFGDGAIRFSYINMDAYDETELPLVVITWEPLLSPNAHYQITSSGVGVVDTDMKPVSLEYVPDSECIFVRTVIPPTCLLDGYTDHVCACGENFQTDTTQKLGHDIQHIPAQKVSCTEVGWEAYDGCTRCDYGGYVEIPALGHDEIHHEGKPVTCLEMGWEPYVTCSRCDHSTYVQIPALGHRVIQNRPALADPVEIRNENATPFQVIDGVYYSANHADNSYSEFEIHALHDCEITLTYSVSSEQNYDKLFLLLNGQQKDVISGFVTDKQRTLQLRTGDVLKIRYSKDGSAEAGEDRGWVKLDFEQLIMNVPTQVPAEEGEPTCTEAVVCIDCGTLIKEALGHIEVSHGSKAATCTEVGWDAYVTCSRCDHTTYVEIPALGHDEIPHDAKEVTCLEIGWDAYVTCSRCDHTTYAQIPALGHNIIHYPGQQATCTQDGWDAHDGCSRCDYGNEIRIPALGHDEIAHEGKPVTCLEIGWDAYVTCSRCDYTTYAQIPAAGHSFQDKLCVSCGVEQSASKQWDVSTGADGSVMAYAYINEDGTYFLEITGSGATKNYTSSSPFNSLNGKIGNICIRDGVTDIGNFLFSNITIQGDITFADSVVSIGRNAFRYFAGPKTITLPASVTTIGNVAFYNAKNLVVILQGEEKPSDLASNWDYYCGHYFNPQQVITTDDAVYVIDQNGKAWLAKYCADEPEFVAENEVSGVPVTGIGDFAFSQKLNLVSCTIPKQITDLGRTCFNQCNKLTIFFESETLPSSDGSWNSGNPYYLAPQSVMQFTDRIYVVDQNGQLWLARYLGSDSTVTVEEEVAGLPVQHIGDYAFRSNSNLQTLYLPDGLQAIGAYAFQSNSRLQNLTLPDTVHTIGQRAFYNSALKNVVLPENLTEIPQYAFYGTKLTSITIPRNLQSIDTSAFRSCSYLKVVNILSEKIAGEITTATSCGDLCRYAQTVVIPVNIENAWISQTYSYVEEAQVAGATGMIYSKHAHSWQENVISEMVPCQTDGVILYTCSSCAVEKEWIEQCHDKLFHEPMAPTCAEIGWDAYETCSRCDYSTYQELPPLGHRVIISDKEAVDPLSVKNDPAAPFAFADGTYYSGNHSAGSSSEITFTALYDCSVQLYYGVSSEAHCDQLYIFVNGSQLDVISGIDIQGEQTVSLAVGDVLTVRYQKDGSVDYGEDRGWVKPEYDFVLIGDEQIVPAEALEPTCTNSVVCSFCDTVVKEAVDHNYAASFTWNWDHTACEAVIACVYNCGEKETVTCEVAVVSADDRRTTHTAKVCVEGKNYTDTMTCDHHLVRFLDWDGAELHSAYYHVGSRVTPPADPAREADETTVYTFAGWDQEVDTCKGDITYTATYAGELRQYTIVFKNWDGTILSEETYHWAEPITFPEDPTRPADNTYTYRFKGWPTGNGQCFGSSVYVAQYDADYINYLVTFKDWNGTVLSSGYYHWGDEIAAPAAPERGPDSACTYEFAGWDRAVTLCAGNATYKATYTPTYIDYTVTFQNWDGTQLSQATYHWGDKVTPPADPTKEGNAEITYYFAGWDKTVGPCYGDTVYTAVFTTQKIKYTVIFQNWDGTQLSKRTCYWGDTVTAPTAPRRAADNTYTYVFAGWDQDVVPCAGNTTYTATFTPIYIDYTVVFKDWNGAELSSDTYHWGEAVVAPAEPQRAADNTYTYAFAGWDKEVTACAGSATYTATYTPKYIDYTVTFQNWDGTLLSERTYHWGDKVTPPANPTKDKDGYYAYSFAGWDKAVVNCAGDAVYRAVFTQEHYHTYDRQVTPPNCTEKGYTTFTCACGHSYRGDYVDALGHSYQTTVVKPTYTQKGYTDYVCHCGSTDRKNFKDPLGLPEPVVKVSVDQNRDMQVVTWNAVPEATGYMVYRATSKSGKYSLVAEIESVSWHDATASVSKTYYYKVKAVCSSDTSCNSGYSNIVSILFKCAAPEIGVKNDAKGKPYITWEKVGGAKKYTVYRATSATGKYSKLGTTTKAYYTDSKAKSGATYFYKVMANASKSKYNSGYSNVVSCGVICGTPSVTVKIDANTGKPGLSWKKVDGAARYAIYRKLPTDADFVLLAEQTAVTYADKTAPIDAKCEYYVQALSKTESLNGAASKAVSATSGIAKPVLTGSIHGVTGKPVITWQVVEGAVKYEIYRSTKSSKSYKLVATVESLSYTDETVSAGKTYYYKVKAIGAVSKSADSSYVKLTGKCATPVITVAVSESSGKPVLSWEKVSGAKKYTVYYATSATGKYKSLGTTTKATYTHTKASAGTVYFYKIVANASSKKYNSPYSNIVSCGVNCATPVAKVTTNASGQPVLSWGKVTGAVLYEIYKNGQLLTSVTGTGYTDTAAQAGESCSYTVKAINKIADYNSAMSNAVAVTATCATPKLTGKVGENKKPVISWGEVEGAVKYEIYRSTSKSKGYKVIGDTDTLTYEDLTAKKGKTYYYKVVAVGDGFQSAQSGYVKVKSK